MKARYIARELLAPLRNLLKKLPERDVMIILSLFVGICCGLAAVLLFHVLVNIGMTTGLMPVIGIPLPFLSYGGSSLLAFTIFVAIALRLDASPQNFSAYNR